MQSFFLWPRKISNNDIFKLTKQEDVGIVLARRRWHWIGHDYKSVTSLKLLSDGLRRVKGKEAVPNPPGNKHLGLQRTERNRE